MKKYHNLSFQIFCLLFFFFPIISFTQVINSEVISSSGESNIINNISASITIGEPVTNYCTNGNYKLLQGFQRPETNIVLSGFDFELFAFMEGPYETGQMKTDLNHDGDLSLSQPYDTYPWNYFGSEVVTSIPNSDIVDWLLIELRDASNAESANKDKIIEKKACFLKNDGSLVGLDGESLLHFSSEVSQNLFVVVHHRNHLSVMSSNPLSLINNTFYYDFSSEEYEVYGGLFARKEIETGKWVMLASDGDANGHIDNKDKNDVFINQLGEHGYRNGDFNLDGNVDLQDRLLWVPNVGLGFQLPE